MIVEENELRQAITLMDSYKDRVEALNRQVQVLRVSLEEVTMTAEALKAFKNAKEGEEIMVPVGASSYITVKVTSNKNVVVGIGSNVSVEKDVDDAIGYMEANNAEITEAYKKTIEALNKTQQGLADLNAAVQNGYRELQEKKPIQ